MIEREMQELLWLYPEELLNEALTQVAWEARSEIGRADLVFGDRHGRLWVVEVKRGKLPRGAIDQLLDYFGMMKLRFPEKPIELIEVANVIPSERRQACESREIECYEISEKRFRVVAARHGYCFISEAKVAEIPSAPQPIETAPETLPNGVIAPSSYLSFGRSGSVQRKEEEFWSSCDEEGKYFFSRLIPLVHKLGGSIDWAQEEGFVAYIEFWRIGRAQIVWGLPGRHPGGEARPQYITFPFDKPMKQGLPKSFVTAFYHELSAVIPLEGNGEYRRKISISGLTEEQVNAFCDTFANLARKAAAPRPVFGDYLAL